MYRVLHKNWDKLCLRIVACYLEWTFTFGGRVHWPHVVILFWWHQQKNDRMHLYRLLCEVFAWCVKFLFVQVFRLSWEEILSPLSILSVFFCHQVIYTLPASPTTKCFHLEETGAHLACWHQQPMGAKVSNSASSNVLSVVVTAVGEWLWVCRVFLAQMEVPSIFKVLDIKQWSSLNFQASSRLILWLSFGAVQRSELPSFYLYLSFPHCLPFF